MISSILNVLTELQKSADGAGVVLTDIKTLFIITVAISLGLSLVLFVFKGIGLHTIGKREGVSSPFLAFIPIVNIFYMGKIVGKVRLFGYKVNNMGVFAMIAYACQLVFAGVFDWLYCGETLINLFKTGVLVMPDIVSPYTLFNVIDLIQLMNVLSYISGIIYLVLDVFLIFAFFRYYGGKNATLYSILAVIIEPLAPIFIFIVRKNERFDFSQFMRMTFESYNAQGSKGGYNNPQNPYYGHSSSNFEDPFQEYAKTAKRPKEDVFTDYPETPKETTGDKNTTLNDDEDLF